jgi:hypothetical protein
MKKNNGSKQSWLTVGMCSSQSLASIRNWVRVSKFPTSRTTLGWKVVVGPIAASASFFLGPRVKAEEEQ